MNKVSLFKWVTILGCYYPLLRILCGVPIGVDIDSHFLFSPEGFIVYLVFSGIMIYNLLLSVPAFIALLLSLEKWQLKYFKLSDYLLLFHILFSVLSFLALFIL